VGKTESTTGDGQQNHLTVQVVANLERFLLFVRRLVELVVALGLEKEVADLPRDHRDHPAREGADHRMRKQQDIRRHERHRTQ
jgi:hypothetical protein